MHVFHYTMVSVFPFSFLFFFYSRDRLTLLAPTGLSLRYRFPAGLALFTAAGLWLDSTFPQAVPDVA